MVGERLGDQLAPRLVLLQKGVDRRRSSNVHGNAPDSLLWCLLKLPGIGVLEEVAQLHDAAGMFGEFHREGS